MCKIKVLAAGDDLLALSPTGPKGKQWAREGTKGILIETTPTILSSLLRCRH